MRIHRSRLAAATFAATLLIGVSCTYGARALATVRPPTDSLAVEIGWLDQSSAVWHVRLRVPHCVTTGTVPGAPAFTALALRTADTLAITGTDSVLVTMRASRAPFPGFPTMLPSDSVSVRMASAPGAPAGGAWRGTLGARATAITLPNEPVDVSWFVRVRAGTSQAVLNAAVRSATFGFAGATPGGSPVTNLAFKNVVRVRVPAEGGGGGPIHAQP